MIVFVINEKDHCQQITRRIKEVFSGKIESNKINTSAFSFGSSFVTASSTSAICSLVRNVSSRESTSKSKSSSQSSQIVSVMSDSTTVGGRCSRMGLYSRLSEDKFE